MAKTPVAKDPPAPKGSPLEKRQKKIARWTAQIEKTRAKMAKSKDEAKNTIRAKKIARLESRIAKTQAKVDKTVEKVTKKKVKAERKAVKAEVRDGPLLDEIRTCAFPLCGREFKPWSATAFHCSSPCACLSSYKREGRPIPQTVINRIWKKLTDRVKTNLEAHGIKPVGKLIDDDPSTPEEDE